MLNQQPPLTDLYLNNNALVEPHDTLHQQPNPFFNDLLNSIQVPQDEMILSPISLLGNTTHHHQPGVSLLCSSQMNK
jgi:hypothetical protein